MTITIFLIANDELSDRLFATIADWTAAGLLAESMWVRAGDWQHGEPALHDVGVEVLSGARRHGHLLLPLLGTRRIDHVRLVVVHLAGAGRRVDTPLTAAVRTLVGLLTNRLPGDTGITVLNVMIPSSETGQLPRSMLLDLPGAPVVNIAVSPEDRRSDAHADIAVRDGWGGNYIGHAALAGATVSGLWRGVATGPLDTSSSLTPFDEDVVITRSFASVVRAGALVDQVCAEALAPRPAWPAPHDPNLAPLSPADDPAAAVDRIAGQCTALAAGALRHTALDRPAPPTRLRVGGLRLVPGLAAFLTTQLWRPPADLAVHATPSVLERADRLTGAWRAAGPATEPDPTGPGDQPGALPPLDRLAAEAARVIGAVPQLEAGAVPAGPAAAGAAGEDVPDVWAQVRGVAFGLVDGGGLPAGVDPPAAGPGRGVVGDPALIAPDPSSAGTMALQEELARLLPGAGPGLAGGGPYEAGRVRALLTAAADRADRPPAPPAPAQPPAPPGPAAGTAADLRAAVAALDGWTGRRSGSLLWKLGDRLVDEITAARAEMVAGLTALGRPAEVTGSRALRRAWAGCRRVCLTTVLLALALIAGYRVAGVASGTFWAATAATVVVAVAVGTGARWRYRRVEVGLRNGIARDRARYDTGFGAAGHGAAEVVRLVARYRELQEWTAVIGAVVHRPWGVPPAPQPPAVPPPAQGSAMAYNLADGRTSADQVRALVAGATAMLFGPGWLGRVFDGFARPGFTGAPRATAPAAPAGSAGPAGPDGNATAPDPVADLCRAVTDGRWAAHSYQRGRAAVAAYCLRQPVSRLVDSVTPSPPEVDIDGAAGADPGVEEFVARTLPSPRLEQYLLGQLWSETARARQSHRVDQVLVWGPGGVAGAGSLPAAAQWLPLPNIEGPGGDLLIRVIRLDCSARTPSRDLRLFTSVVTPVSRL